MGLSVRAIVASSLIMTAAVAPLAIGTAPDLAQGAGQAQAETVVINSGSLWVKGANEVEGLYRIERRADGVFIVLGSDFKTKKGPDLKLVLSPLAADKVKAKTALDGSLNLGLLKSEKGRQEFRLPDGTELTRYRSVLIHCELKTKLWSAAALSEGEVVAYGSSWKKKASNITGSWEIGRTSSGYELRLGADFKTKKAPDLKLVLSPHTTTSAQAKNALAGGLVIAPLGSVKGAQTYQIDAGVDLASFRSVLIHCELKAKLWGAAELKLIG